ncbi:MAG TPA: hypothetical protein GXZ35_07980, partial [Acholeplasmataceae bacterium]|nr:hypothetical protein [Acholeplasmataceae bacterium]
WTLYLRDGIYIYFGEYPQTIKEDNVVISTEQDSRGYFLGSDGVYYAKVVASQHGSYNYFSDGKRVTNGVIYYFKVEPIKWRILNEGSGEALILCESIIANKRYDDPSNNYKESEIRAWLNDQFYNTAFTNLQKQLVITTEVDNSVYSTGYDPNAYACENTFDKVFLLSYREVTNSSYGFSSDSSAYDTARQKVTSDYSRATGADTTTSSPYYGNGFWWLRSPGSSNSLIARYLNNAGYVYIGAVNYTYNGVVPALKIKLN